MSAAVFNGQRFFWSGSDVANLDLRYNFGKIRLRAHPTLISLLISFWYFCRTITPLTSCAPLFPSPNNGAGLPPKKRCGTFRPLLESIHSSRCMIPLRIHCIETLFLASEVTAFRHSGRVSEIPYAKLKDSLTNKGLLLAPISTPSYYQADIW
jgi:hypothetical protein